SKFYRQTFGIKAPQIPLDKPLVLELKDLTFVVLTYCSRRDQVGAEGYTDQLLDAIRQIPRRLTRLNYCNRTPSILVSPESPILTWAARLHFQDAGVRTILEKQLGVDLHLFGAGPVVFIPFEPFVHKHIGLSTGPRVTGNGWPHLFNLIKFDS